MTVHRLFNKILVCAALAALSVPAAAQPGLAPHEAEYKVKISVLGGRLDTRLARTGDGYTATHTIQATGMSRLLAGGQIRETAHFARMPNGLRPVTFETSDTLTHDQTHASVKFDWDSGEAVGTINDENFRAAMQGMAFDRVSIQYELMSDLLNNDPSTEYILFDIDEFKTVQVRNIGSKTVKVPAGEFQAVGLQHQVVGSKRITTMWCVAELDYLPVIIEQHRKGELKMRAELSSYAPLAT
jgi:hypothetical protein